MQCSIETTSKGYEDVFCTIFWDGLFVNIHWIVTMSLLSIIVLICFRISVWADGAPLAGMAIILFHSGKYKDPSPIWEKNADHGKDVFILLMIFLNGTYAYNGVEWGGDTFQSGTNVEYSILRIQRCIIQQELIQLLLPKKRAQLDFRVRFINVKSI